MLIPLKSADDKNNDCLFKNSNQPDIATVTQPMVWAWGGAICLFDQWQMRDVFEETCLRTIQFLQVILVVAQKLLT